MQCRFPQTISNVYTSSLVIHAIHLHADHLIQYLSASSYRRHKFQQGLQIYIYPLKLILHAQVFVVCLDESEHK